MLKGNQKTFFFPFNPIIVKNLSIHLLHCLTMKILSKVGNKNFNFWKKAEPCISSIRLWPLGALQTNGSQRRDKTRCPRARVSILPSARVDSPPAMRALRCPVHFHVQRNKLRRKSTGLGVDDVRLAAPEFCEWIPKAKKFERPLRAERKRVHTHGLAVAAAARLISKLPAAFALSHSFAARRARKAGEHTSMRERELSCFFALIRERTDASFKKKGSTFACTTVVI